MGKYYDKTKKPFDSTYSSARFSEDKQSREIESQWLETKAHREKWEEIAEKYRKRNFFPAMIEEAERIAKLTHWEYELECIENTRKYNEMRNEYVKNNPMKESVVEELYRRFDKIMDNHDEILCYGSSVLWHKEIHPLEIMSHDDWEFVYTPLIDSLHEQFLQEHGK